MLWSITEHHRARGVFELWKSLPETARRAFAAEFSSGGASNAEPCGPSDYSRQCELRSGHLEAVGVRSEAVAPTLCKCVSSSSSVLSILLIDPVCKAPLSFLYLFIFKFLSNIFSILFRTVGV